MASDLQEQLAILRRRIAKIDNKFANLDPAPPFDRNPERYSVEQWLDGKLSREVASTSEVA